MLLSTIHFYATAHDLRSALSAPESAGPLQYTRTGLFETDRLQTYPSCSEIPDFGRAIHPTAIANPCYLVSRRGTQIEGRAVPQQDGAVRWAVDQQANPSTVALMPGGRFGNVAIFLHGTLGTVSGSAESQELYRTLAGAFRKTFHELESRIKTFTSLPIASLERSRLQERLREIGRTRADTDSAR